ncbi:MAG: hypothetical protein QOF21_769 [Actinomycetota bacterium]
MGRRLAFGTAAALCLGLISVALLYYAFTGRASYDDEGYVLISLRGWMSGHPLYSEVYSQYGPGFYAVVGGGFRILGKSFISLEAARAATVMLGVITASSLGYATAKIAKSAGAGLLAAVVVALFAPIGVEAALHPTHLIEALIGVTMVGVVSLEQRRSSRLAAVLVGAGVTLAVLTKINVGAFLVVAVAIGLGFTPRATSARWRMSIVVAITALAALFVAVGDYPTQFVTMLALAAVVVVLSVDGIASDVLPRTGVLIAAVATGLVVLVNALVSGTSLVDVVRGVVVEPTHLSDAYTYAMAHGRLTIGALVVVAIIGRFVNVRERPLASGLALLALGGGTFVAAYEMRFAPGVVHGVNLLVVGASLSWVVTRSEHTVSSSRLVLCALGVLLPLQAYPVAGGQRMAGALVFPVIGAIAIIDGLRAVAAAPRVRELGGLRVELITALMVVVALAVSVNGVRHARDRREGTDLLTVAPGSHIRTSYPDAVETEAVTAALDQCTTFFSVPGLNSFYFFADKQPPTWQNAGAWQTLFDKSRQANVVRDLRRVDGLCVVRNPKIASMWTTGGHEISGALLPYLDTFTTQVASVGDYTIYRKPGA